MKKELSDLANIEESFFDLDKERRIAHMKLEFASPSEIFDKNSVTKLPVFNDEFSEWIASSFEYAPRGYKIDLEVIFDDMEGYGEEDLESIFKKNTALEFKRSQRKHRYKSKIAFGLLCVGILFLGAMILMAALWQEERPLREILIAIIEIASWVAIWEALDVFIIENSERRQYMKNLARRFDKITFRKK